MTLRAAAYDESAVAWFDDCFTPLMNQCAMQLVSWEAVLDAVEAADAREGRALKAFYSECLRYNPFRSTSER